MKTITIIVLLPFLVLTFSCSGEKEETKITIPGQVIWHIDNITSIRGHTTTVSGFPEIIETPEGKAVEFDGEKDALFVDTHPLEGINIFTVEVIFRPDAGGLEEQRFFHIQEDGSDNRILFETRLIGDDKWSLDTFIMSGETAQTLLDKRFTHSVGEWYNVTLVFDGREMRHYVNGVKELSAEISSFTPPVKGQTSIGVRINKVYWFKGAVRMARFTPQALSPEDFLKP